MLSRHRRRLSVVAAAVVALLLLAGCSNFEPSSQANETRAQQGSYDSLSANQPAQTMAHSPTREQLNFWIDTWDEPGKLSYVYLQNADGAIISQGVFEGLPVSYCVSLTPNYTWVEAIDPDTGREIEGSIERVPAPSVDGAYYSGGDCNKYYAKDATSGAYVQYSVGQGINELLYDQPLPGSVVGNALPLNPPTLP